MYIYIYIYRALNRYTYVYIYIYIYTVYLKNVSVCKNIHAVSNSRWFNVEEACEQRVLEREHPDPEPLDAPTLTKPKLRNPEPTTSRGCAMTANRTSRHTAYTVLYVYHNPEDPA